MTWREDTIIERTTRLCGGSESSHLPAFCPLRRPSDAVHSLSRPVMYEIDAPPRPAAGRSLPSWPTGRPLRAWQQAAAAEVFSHSGDAFLASATPAAGKTTFGLHVAHRMLSEGRVSRVAVVAPTTHICRQWALDAARYGIQLEPNRPNSAGPEPRDRHGVAVTYATVAAGSEVHRRRCAERPTLLIADEPHHMGEDATWGRSTIDAFARARFRLLLSGTPFRSDNSPIPWVSYDDEGVSRADYDYGYTQALVDGVCRPGDLPHLRRRHGVGERRTGPAGGLRRRAARAGGRAAAAHGAGPGGRLDHPRPARRRRGAADDPRRRPSRGGRPGRRDGQGARRQARRPAGADHGRAAGHRALRRGRRVGADRALLVGLGALAGVGADGLRGRRRAAPAGRRLRHDGTHRALLPPGDRALHPPHARRRRSRCRTSSCPPIRG